MHKGCGVVVDGHRKSFAQVLALCTFPTKAALLGANRTVFVHNFGTVLSYFTQAVSQANCGFYFLDFRLYTLSPAPINTTKLIKGY
jgi:hypothetical protein